IKSMHTYENGVKKGIYIDFHINGIKKSEGMYDNNIRIGKWTFWGMDGINFARGNYKDGMAEDIWESWYDLQRLEKIENYKNGKKVGNFVKYNRKGILIEKGQYDDIGYELFVGEMYQWYNNKIL